MFLYFLTKYGFFVLFNFLFQSHWIKFSGVGIAFLYAARELERLATANFNQKIGVQIMQNALKTQCVKLPKLLALRGLLLVSYWSRMTLILNMMLPKVSSWLNNCCALN